MITDNMLKVGQLKSAYGIKGWIWLYSHTEPMETIFDHESLFFVQNNEKKSLTVGEWRKQGKGLVVKFVQIADRTQAEQILGTDIFIDKKSLPELLDDEFYWSDLVGMTVVNLEQEILGTVKRLSETKAHQLLEVVAGADSLDDLDRLIPFHDSTIETVNLEQKQIVVAWQSDY